MPLKLQHLNGRSSAYASQVTSRALVEWNTSRRQKINLLWGVHPQLTGNPPTLWREHQALAIVIQRMATEFQGFARDLHDECTDVFSAEVAAGNSAVENVLRERLTSDRALSRGNAHSDGISKDFGRLGMTFWPSMIAADSRANNWKKDLLKLVEMRNGVAHDDAAKLARLQREGYTLDAASLQKWQTMLDDIATSMDDMTSTYLSALLGIQRPW
ncbi:hypothetical protein N8I84_26935 [Streptomyces cynarae]|uniref:RiboL-PSP-HEPN domain-containing protein n=1 Tax=Streptomyces cynarae TaxID=2981134 RepID=A0ABY6E5I5_9ACTN|nr:hypothetical protein [Streptomyces cynarae]UXY21931.1 hypothetical protein N8I84_26935 [Streptomyces cynarae]